MDSSQVCGGELAEEDVDHHGLAPDSQHVDAATATIATTPHL